MSEPIHIISLGAGVQSSCMSLMAAAGEIMPMPAAAIFADTQAEPDAVMNWLSWLEKKLPFPVYRVTAGSLAAKVTTPYWSNKNKKMTTSGIPAYVKNVDGTVGIMSRQCTRDFKVAPVDKQITAVMRQYGTRKAIKWLGISTDEIYRIKPSRRNTVENRWPLIEIRVGRNECLNWMKRNGFPTPPRSACTFCPYHSNDEWANLTPKEFMAAVEFEKALQVANSKATLNGIPFLHRSCKPLDQVDLSTEEERGQLNMFNNECEGMCGV